MWSLGVGVYVDSSSTFWILRQVYSHYILQLSIRIGLSKYVNALDLPMSLWNLTYNLCCRDGGISRLNHALKYSKYGLPQARKIAIKSAKTKSVVYWLPWWGKDRNVKRCVGLLNKDSLWDADRERDMNG